jgi:pyruvate dehydrogenase E2 component (dihydrolipoamide acetyltransferase)
MTSESRETIPHAGGNYEPDITEFWNSWLSLRKEPQWADITANTLLLFVVIQGLKACPELNGHVFFRRRSANGRVEFYENIDISVPMTLPAGGMMPVTVYGCEQMRLRDLADAVADVRRRMAKTDFDEVMFEAALDNTLHLCRRGRADIVLPRLLGATFGKGRTTRLRGQEKRDYLAIPETERLTKNDIRQGTVTVSNYGSLYRGAYAPPTLLEIIPPQICVIGIGGLTERPGYAETRNDRKEISPRKYLPFSILTDHRALDYGNSIPFMKRLDEIFAHPEHLAQWIQ